MFEEVPVQELFGQLLAEILFRTYLPGDPGLPPAHPLIFGDGSLTLPFDVAWKAVSLGSPTVTHGNPPFTVELPSRDDVILWMGSFYVERRNNTADQFNQELARAIGRRSGEEPSWDDQIARFVALPTRPREVLRLLRNLITLDAIILLIAQHLEGEAEVDYEAKGGNAQVWSTLASLTTNRVDFLDYLKEWCKMLDALFHREPGTMYQRLESRLQELRIS